MPVTEVKENQLESERNEILPQIGASGKKLSPAAQRALAEAELRRKTTENLKRPPEINGRSGPDPVRYGDWETKGIVSDF